ncbi:hypothetical protein [Parasitella parasitica]|uniref:Uncharacterized protein n=1 Tax=Parasitella parasitica TaxID=35722 RepID=A0A0B7N0D4_9FUNG|nr:hypothetical protein [Parasitella parasitica]
MFGTAISNKEDLIYYEIALLTPLGTIAADPERRDATSEDLGELVPTEYDAVPCDHQDIGYKQQSLLLNRNASNSYYTDAPLELLLGSVLPYIKESFFENRDFNNSFDNALFDAFQLYEEGNSIIGSQLIRNLSGDIYPNMKDYYSIRKTRDLLNQDELTALLQQRFEKLYHKKVLHNKRLPTRCKICGKTSAYKSSLIHQDIVPEFLFHADPTNRDHKHYTKSGQLKEVNLQVFFPEEFTVDLDSGKQKYEIPARTYSTHPKGLHYYSIGKILTAADEKALYKFDNLRTSAQYLDTLSNTNKYPKLLNLASNTVIVCYKRKH